MSPSPLSKCLYHAHRISKLVHEWDTLRGPGMAMPPENIDQLLSEISHPDIASTHLKTEHITPLLERIQKAERILINTLIDPVYLNDDRDREIIVARIALCNILKQLREMDANLRPVNMLWQKNEGDEWATL
ncbi:MAG: hypothetical protein ACO36I_15625 [Candidatus Latescibacterota bacterium]|jgi:hypothetical protein